MKLQNIPNHTKQLKFFFRIGLSYGMIAFISHLTANGGFAFEQRPPFSYYEVIQQRNIFRPKNDSNSVAQQQTTAAAPVFISPASESDDFTLTGVIKIRGAYKATLHKKSDQKGFYVRVNDSIDGFVVSDIQPNKVTLTKDGQTYELGLNAPTSETKPDNVTSDDNATKTDSRVQTDLQNESAQDRGSIMRSIRLGIPNVQKN